MAEVLITLAVIGVVAAITMPSVIANINERRNSERHANIAYKVTQAMEQMRAHGLLNVNYESTEAFVDELQKYLKIAKRCDKDHITECWPSDKVTDGDGNEFEVSDAKTGKNLNLQTDTNNVGLILADGASIILNYNPDSSTIDVGDAVTANTKYSLPVGNGKTKEFPYTTSVTNSIDFVMDVNGGGKPNSETINNKYYDIRSFNKARFTKGCAGTKIPGIGCVVQLVTYEASGTTIHGGNNYWQGAKDAYEAYGNGYKLPDKATLYKIYQQKGNYSTLPQSGWFWSSSENGSYHADYVDFGSGAQASNGAKHGQFGVLCVK